MSGNMIEIRSASRIKKREYDPHVLVTKKMLTSEELDQLLVSLHRHNKIESYSKEVIMLVMCHLSDLVGWEHDQLINQLDAFKSETEAFDMERENDG